MLNSVFRSRLNFEFHKLIPHCVSAVSLRNGKQFPQPSAWIVGLWLLWTRLASLHVNGWRAGLFWNRLFFIHIRIITVMSLTRQSTLIPRALSGYGSTP